MITAEQLRNCLGLDPHSGQFTWLIGKRKGKPAGRIKRDGYIQIQIEGKDYQAHRLVWLSVCGAWPNGPLDHRNGIKNDNRISNLRLASPSQNAANRIKTGPGLKGTTYLAKHRKWQASITTEGRWLYLGLYSTPEEAHAAYSRAATEHFGEFARMS